ncbi:HTH-type transcriptional regulator zntR [Methylophaga frappieri]|jgi:MerR family Zn(II)-responsive transcriptional regulator of zntA|uniref:HTH-type transcriptional regulator zntR n=1 Tax=Methylophaga frappieri (strain ATCC BAA-2434 / DSM 25690 / JAM7) TaxID=754477 RepID=I1YJB6_METFJ|nr:Zn(2+)-responsive transcriptional regulator [Methylophaga frappieri]AFJ03009.1 HTH-type transcriptional regulator zntR [Methylophaga frappieri]
MKISEFSTLSGVPVDTLRYYEKIGLLKAETRSNSGYRDYGDASLETVRFILSAKSLGFTLETIQKLLQIQVNKQDASCEDVKQFVADQLELVNQRLAELQKIKQAMQRLHGACCGGKENASYCSILQALEAGNV